MSDLGVRRPGQPLPSSDPSSTTREHSSASTTAASPSTNTAPSDLLETGSTANHAVTPGTTTNVERVAAGLLNVQGSLSSPRVILDSSSAVGQVQNGSVEVRIPLNAGHEIGPTTVREDTWVNVQLAVKNGNIDRKNTRILFENSDGERTDLDGPFIWDAEQIYIDKDGQLKADVPCFPDPNITEKVLGRDKIPENIEDFVALLASHGQMPQAQPLIEPLSVSNLLNGKPIPPPHEGVSANRTISTNTDGTNPSAHINTRTDSTTSRPSTRSSAATNSLDGMLRFSEAQIRFSGSLKTGPMSFGDGLELHIAPDTQIEGSGSFDNLDVALNGNISQMTMEAKDSILSAGNGHIRVDANIRSSRHADGSLDKTKPKHIDCAITELRGENIYLETPGIERRHRLKLESLAIQGNDSQRPLAHFSRDYSKAHPDMVLNLPNVEMRGLSADIEVTGADGSPANFLIGEIDRTHDSQNVDLTGSIHFDSLSGDFDFEATTKGLNARLISSNGANEESVVELVESDHFNLSLNEALISGSGAIGLHSSGGVSSLNLDADDDNPWTFQIDVDDATFNGDPERTKLALDLSTDTHGVLRLDTFNLNEGQKPQFEGDAEFAVTLDALSFKAEDVPGLELKPGTQGTLKVHNMAWAEGDPSPSIDATLELKLGADALLDIENIPGLEGARVNIDAETGQTSLLMDVQLLGDGTLNSQVDINLKGLFLRTDFERGTGNAGTLPEIELPNEPIPEVGTMALLPVDDSLLMPGPENLSTSELSTSYVPTNLPDFAIQPMDIFTELEKAQIRLTCPLNRTSFNIANENNTHLEDLGILGSDKVGYTARVDLIVPSGQMSTALHVVNGKVAPNVSRLNVSPALKLDIDLTAYGYGPLSTSADVTATISSLVIRRDPKTGKGYLEPIYELEMSGALGIANIIDYVDSDDSFIKDMIRDRVNDELTSAVFGRKTIPLDEGELLELLSAQIPDLREPIQINSQDLVDSSLPSRNSSPEGGASSNRASSTPASSTSANTTSSVRTSTSSSNNLAQIVDLASAQLTVENTELKPTTLNLGDGQFISFAPDSQLALHGDLDDFTIEGKANISSLQLGKEEMGVNLGESTIDVKIRVKAGRAGASPTIELELSNITTTDLNLRGQVPSGKIDIKNARVQNASLVIQTGGSEEDTFNLKLPQIEGEFAGVVAPPVLDSHDTQTLIAVHHAHLKGNLELDSTGRVNIEDSVFSELSASIVSPPIIDKSLAGDIENANYVLNFQQVDVSGSALINVEGENWSIKSTVPGEATMQGRAIANDVAFGIIGPEIALDLAPQAEIEMSLENFSVDAEKNVQFAARDFQVLGTLDSGHITTSAPATDPDDASIVPKKITIQPGTRVAVDLDNFSANFADLEDSLLTAGTLRLEGALLEPGNVNELKHRSELGKLHLSNATYDRSDFRMIVGLKTDGLGNIAATSKTSLDFDATLEFEGNVNHNHLNNALDELNENE